MNVRPYSLIDRGDIADKTTPDIFFKYLKKWKEDKGAYPPPAIVSIILYDVIMISSFRIKTRLIIFTYVVIIFILWVWLNLMYHRLVLWNYLEGIPIEYLYFAQNTMWSMWTTHQQSIYALTYHMFNVKVACYHYIIYWDKRCFNLLSLLYLKSHFILRYHILAKTSNLAQGKRSW